jgi:hypothetical protein
LFNYQRRLAGSTLTLCLLLPGCVAPAGSQLPGPGLPGGDAAPAAIPAPLRPAAPVPAPVAAPAPLAAPTVSILTSLQGQPLAGATVRVSLAKDLSVVADGLTTDTQGRVTLPLSNSLPPGTLVVVQATTASTALSGLFLVPQPGFVNKQVSPGNAPGQWLLDLATSVATRKLTSKLAEVIRSNPTGAKPADLQALVNQVQQLVQDTRAAFTAGFQDDRVNKTLSTVVTAPSLDNVESLANALVRYSQLQGGFKAAVDQCNGQVVTNLGAGGPLVVPALWQIAEVSVQPPLLVVTGEAQIPVRGRH